MYDMIMSPNIQGGPFVKHVISVLLALFLLALPAAASPYSQSQVILRATEEGQRGACRDVSLGSYVADTMRQAADTDFALLPSGLLGLNLQPGPVDEAVLFDSFPKDEMVYVVTLTAPQLRELLETSAAPLALDETEGLDRDASQWDGFLQISGFYVIYSVSFPAGERIYELTLEDGTEPDLSDESLTFTAAVPQSLLDGTYGYPTLTPGREVGPLRELVSQRIAAEGVAGEPDDRRIILYGANENKIIDSFPPLLIVFVIVLFAFFGGHKWRRSANFER